MKFKEYKLSELSKDNKGTYGIGASAVEYSKDLYTYLRITDIKEDGSLDYKNLKSVDDKNAEKYLLKKGDIVFARTGNSTGKAYYYDGEIQNLVYAGFLIKFSLDENKVNPKFMKYYTMTKEYKNWVKEIQTGSTRGNINEKMYGNMKVRLPSRIYQDKMVALLECIDRKVELNVQINNNLLEIQRILFMNTFINNKSSKKIKLSELVQETIGGDWGKEEEQNSYNQKVLCIRGADIPEMAKGNKGKSPIRYILEKNLNNKRLIGNEIIIEISGGSPTQSTGRTAHITKMLENSFELPLICTNFCRAIRLKESKNIPNFYMTLNYLYNKNIMFLYENGTTGIKNLDLNSLIDNEEICIVEDNLCEEFNNIYYSLNDKIVKNEEQNIILEQLRDTLLPKLMNGEIDLDKIEI